MAPSLPWNEKVEMGILVAALVICIVDGSINLSRVVPCQDMVDRIGESFASNTREAKCVAVLLTAGNLHTNVALIALCGLLIVLNTLFCARDCLMQQQQPLDPEMDPEMKLPLVPLEKKKKKQEQEKEEQLKVHEVKHVALSVLGFVTAVLSFVWLIFSAVFLAEAVQCAGVDLNRKDYGDATRESLCVVRSGELQPVTAYALGVAFSGFLLLMSLLAWGAIENADRILQRWHGTKPVVLSDDESAAALRNMFKRPSPTEISVQYEFSKDAPFLLFTTNDWRKARPRISFVHFTNDVKSISIGRAQAHECITDVVWTSVPSNEVVTYVQIQGPPELREFVIVPMQGWTAERVSEEMRVILGI